MLVSKGFFSGSSCHGFPFVLGSRGGWEHFSSARIVKINICHPSACLLFLSAFTI